VERLAWDFTWAMIHERFFGVNVSIAGGAYEPGW
jgi:hypothetical protein